MVLLTVTAGRAQDLISSLAGHISGVVLFPDGAPASGAIVEAVTACPEDHVNFVQKVTTAEDGKFNIPPFFQNDCKRVRLSARKGLWLKTGHNVFYGKQIGTTPIVELPESGFPQRTEIRLGELGGSVDFRVWDKATQRFIWAELSINRAPITGLKFGSMMIATGRDGSADTLILPAGTYEVSVDQFACKDRDYFARTPVRETVKVEAGKSITKDISLDVRSMQPRKTYNNPRGAFCVP